jgi:MFS family permease
VSDIAFAGTVVGQLVFGFLADHWSRTNTLMVSTVILIIFTALAAGSYWHGQAVGMFNMLTAWRFFVGIGIGGRFHCSIMEKKQYLTILGEYPAGSVGCAESSGQMKKGTRNRWFILFTNSMIDFGFVIGAFVPCSSPQAFNKTATDTLQMLLPLQLTIPTSAPFGERVSVLELSFRLYYSSSG